MTVQTPFQYLLRDIDARLWTRFRDCAAAEGVSMRTLLIQLITAYVNGAVTLGMRDTRRS